MRINFNSKYLVWLESSIILILGFIFGVFIPLLYPEASSIIFFVITVLLFLVQIFLILDFVGDRLGNRKKVGILLFHSLNLLFAVVIGFSIPLMESEFRYNTGVIMMPLLLILGFIISDKYDNNIKDITDDQDIEEEGRTLNRPVIEFENKKYIFSSNSLIILAVGTPLLAFGIYFFFDTEAQFWLHEIVVKQTAYFLNLFFNMNVSTVYSPFRKNHWSFSFVGNINGDFIWPVSFETFCTGIQAICVFAGIIICTPHSQDKSTNKDIIWRKAKALIVSSVIFYVVNIIRMLIQIELYYLGYPWDSIHVSISAASSFIAAIIILLLHKWIPEFIISIIYIGTLINKKFKQLRNPKESSKD